MVALRDAAAGRADAAGVDGERGALSSVARSGDAIRTIDGLRQADGGETLAHAFGAGKNQTLWEGRTLERARQQREQRCVTGDVAKRQLGVPRLGLLLGVFLARPEDASPEAALLLRFVLLGLRFLLLFLGLRGALLRLFDLRSRGAVLRQPGLIDGHRRDVAPRLEDAGEA